MSYIAIVLIGLIEIRQPKQTLAMHLNNETNGNDFNFNNEKLLDRQDVLQMLHISPRTLDTWRAKGILPYSKIGGKIFYKLSDVWAMVMKYRVDKGK